MLYRVITGIVLFLSIFFVPFWVSLVLAVFAIIYFDYFFEAVFSMLVSDILYGVREEKLWNIVFFSTIVLMLFLILMEVFKRYLKFYNK